MSWPRPSRASGSSSHHMRFQGPLGIRSTRSGGEMEAGHIPVLAEEVMSMLAPAPGSLQIDATLGGGGHTERILEATDPDGRLLGLDADGAAIARVDGRLRPRFGDRLVLRQVELPRARRGRARRRLRRRSTAPSSTSACRATSSPTRNAGSGFGPAARSTCASMRRAACRRPSSWPRSTRTS